MIYAGFWRRVAASLIDAIIIIIPSAIINMVVPFVGILTTLIYKPVFESSILQATPGKAIMGICVADENGERINFKMAFIRFISSFLSGLCLGIGYLMSIFTAKKQSLHDLIARTIVINAEPADVNYFTVWLEQMKKLLNFDENESVKDSSATEKLETLHRLLQSGAITQAEYDEKKAELLKKI
jgi:uncharacterized RDD family membrane protein YckC